MPRTEMLAESRRRWRQTRAVTAERRKRRLVGAGLPGDEGGNCKRSPWIKVGLCRAACQNGRAPASDGLGDNECDTGPRIDGRHGNGPVNSPPPPGGTRSPITVTSDTLRTLEQQPRFGAFTPGPQKWRCVEKGTNTKKTDVQADVPLPFTERGWKECRELPGYNREPVSVLLG
ncbi:hypothetical protein AAFF_G00229270 [Aldrovandia affinis]|uniref:Uncharacterized protein n=1 Tax=Aldrovandia affinis TaxID=143900 RepID=A0AAD7WU30_9TELE|nr:hypothetical protein AAFF_G00229270 [Aldrovandia affinis]